MSDIKFSRDPSPITTFTKDPGPSETTIGGVSGAVTRGLAPIAAGAGIGAAAGAPFAGIGAIPGAAAGAGAVGLSELAASLYNPLAQRMGWPKTATPQEMTDKLLDLFAVKRPATGVERIVESGVGGGAGALGPARAAGEIAAKSAPGLVKSVASRVAERPDLQAASGAVQGVAAQTAGEAGGGEGVREAAGLVGGALPYGRAAVAVNPRAQALEARRAGYVLPPSALSEKPGIISSTLSGWGGKIKTAQDASEHNQNITNSLAASALGLPPNAGLSDQVFDSVRSMAGSSYGAIPRAMPTTKSDPQFDQTISAMDAAYQQSVRLFPKTLGNPEIKSLLDEAKSITQAPTEDVINVVKRLRFEAHSDLKSSDNPAKLALGTAKRQIADVFDGLVERNLSAIGQKDLASDYRNSRQLIAKSYDVQSATNPATGDVDARRIGALKQKGRPLTAELDQIANASLAFPKAAQVPSKFGYSESLSGVDFFAAALAAAHGRPELIGAVLGRPLARKAALSGSYQDAMMSKPAFPTPLITQPGMSSTIPVPGQDVPR